MKPEKIKIFIETFRQLPSIGPRQAIRLAFYLIQSGKNEIEKIKRAVEGLKSIKICPKCFFTFEGNQKYCSICNSARRDEGTILIVEKETDLVSIEKTGKYKGHYLVLGGLAKNGLLDLNQKLRLKSLENRLRAEKHKIKEIIIALNPSTLGDFTASLIEQKFKNLALKVTRLSRGIPTGGEIEFADEKTLISALQGRHTTNSDNKEA